jgi:glycogen synthase
MKIAFVASEVVPYAKTGGLADVAGSLPINLQNSGCEVKIFMPKYYQIEVAATWADAQGLAPTARTFVVLAANIGSFAVLWCGQFMLLDRLLADPA